MRNRLPAPVARLYVVALCLALVPAVFIPVGYVAIYSHDRYVVSRDLACYREHEEGNSVTTWERCNVTVEEGGRPLSIRVFAWDLAGEGVPRAFYEVAVARSLLACTPLALLLLLRTTYRRFWARRG